MCIVQEQQALIMDIITNLVLHKEPRKKVHITLSYTSYIYMEIPMNIAQKKGDPFSYLAVKNPQDIR